MKSSVELYNLISCLSKNEKAYYKLYTRKRLKNHDTYNSIFDTTLNLLKRKKSFESIEETLKSKYAEKLPVYKLRMQQHLLDSLVECTFTERDPIRSIHNSIAYARIFLIKYQYKSALKHFKKAFEMSKKADRYEYQISIAKSILFTISKFSKDDAKIEKLYDEILEDLSQMIDAHNIQLKLIKWLFEINKNMEETDIIRDVEIIEKLKFEVEYGILQHCSVRNARTIEIFNELLVWFYNSTKNYDLHRKHHLETIKEKSRVGHFENNDFQRLFKPYSNILSSSIYLDDEPSAIIYFGKLNKLNTKSDLAEKNKKDILNNFTLRMLDKWGTSEETINHLQKLELFLDVNNPRELLIEIPLAKTILNVLFKYKMYNESVYWLSRLKPAIDSPDYNSLFRGLCVFEMIVQYEIGNNDLLPYLIRNAKRRNKKKRLSFKMEEIMFDLMSDLQKLHNKVEQRKRFSEAKIELEQLSIFDFAFALEDFMDTKLWLSEKQ